MKLNDITLRLETPADYKTVEKLTFEAFKDFEAEGLPKRDLPNEHFLAYLLRNDPSFIKELDFVAILNEEIVGNIMYSKCHIIHLNNQKEALVFGPISVKPELQKQGIGTLLIKHSLEHAQKLGYKAVIITGFPDYYHRFGFVSANTFNLTMLDGSFFDAFMALELEKGYLSKGGKWQCCQAFDNCENNQEALINYHKELFNLK
ncbi:MAG: N-acetyltransferase [Bacillales bacterium]|jgi:predicted N-acetyltransferase YhbS|nr:N-acetyltransferase [Bacillales bacterium]